MIKTHDKEVEVEIAVLDADERVLLWLFFDTEIMADTELMADTKMAVEKDVLDDYGEIPKKLRKIAEGFSMQ